MVLSFDDEATAPNRRYLTGSLVDQILTDETDTGEVRHLLGDHLNTVRDVALFDLLTGDTAVENHVTYSSFNAKLADTDAAFATLFGETGRPHDEATGNNNHLNRWLAPWFRRWLNEDPIGFTASDANVRRAMTNNPISFSDPNGLQVPGRLPPWQRYLDDISKNGGTQLSNGTMSWQCTPRFGPAVKTQKLRVAIYDGDPLEPARADFEAVIKNKKESGQIDIVIKITHDMTIKEIFDKVRAEVGNDEISELHIYDHGGYRGVEGQSLGDHKKQVLVPDDFRQLSDIFVTQGGIVRLEGCGVGQDKYETYRKEISAILHRAEVIACRGLQVPNPERSRLVPQSPTSPKPHYPADYPRTKAD